MKQEILTLLHKAYDLGTDIIVMETSHEVKRKVVDIQVILGQVTEKLEKMDNVTGDLVSSITKITDLSVRALEKALLEVERMGEVKKLNKGEEQ